MRRAAGLAALLTPLAALATAEVPIERIGQVEALAQPPGAHWVFVSDVLLRRSALLDLDRGVFLGMISAGFLSPTPLFPRSRAEFYLPETYYSRGSRGERTDVVTIYDTATLAPVGEIPLPPKRAVNVLPLGNAALSDDERFLAVFNMTPATSLSIVDLERRAFAAEIQTPGCSLAYAAGAARFLMLCGDGALLSVALDASGRAASLSRSQPFFDPQSDPVTEKAVRWRNEWIFVSFEGLAYRVDVSGDAPRVAPAWDLIPEADRREQWRIGGSQHLAVHEPSGRLYSLVHQGGVDSHKDPGGELWIYDLATGERVERLALRHPGFSILSEGFEFGESWPWPFHHLAGWLLDHVVPNPGLTVVAVTQDESPLLVTGTQFGGSIAVYDARTGAFLRRVASGNMTAHALVAPFGGGRP
jgi:methylamine dehydrogenase heavy chain